jgi:hypothetical protein
MISVDAVVHAWEKIVALAIHRICVALRFPGDAVD